MERRAHIRGFWPQPTCQPARQEKIKKLLAFPFLKGENQLIDEVNANTSKFNFEKIKAYSSGKIDHSTILNNYHFGGYAKHAQELLNFKNEFEKDNHIPLDYVYTFQAFLCRLRPHK